MSTLTARPTDLFFEPSPLEDRLVPVELLNLTNDTYAFRIKTTAPKLYCVRPNSGFVLPRQSRFLEAIHVRVRKADGKSADKILVQAVRASSSVDVSTANAYDLVESATSKQVVNIRLRCHYWSSNDSVAGGDEDDYQTPMVGTQAAISARDSIPSPTLSDDDDLDYSVSGDPPSVERKEVDLKKPVGKDAGNKNNTPSWLADLQCGVCLDPVDDNRECPQCHGLFCYACVERLIPAQGAAPGHRTCPKCRSLFDPDTLVHNVVVQRFANQVETPCARGCGLMVQHGNRAEHARTCTHALVMCANEGCVEVDIKRRDLPQHMKVCRYRLVTCEHRCGHEGPFIYLAFHHAECPNVLVTCSSAGCGSKLPRREVERHMTYECVHVLVPCPCARFGCAVRPKRRDLAEHVTSCAYVQVQPTLERMEGQIVERSARVLQLEAMVANLQAELGNKRR